MLAAALATSPALAADAAMVWQDRWDRFRTSQYVATPTVIGASVLVAFGLDYPADSRSNGILLDDAVRDALAAGSRPGRDRARLVADIGWRTLTVYPLLVDPGVAWLGHGSSDVAAQMFWINLQSLSWSAFVSLVPQKLVARGRPSNEPCEADPDYEVFCGASDRNASFPSGHTSLAVTGAALMCVHGEHLPLYGGGLGNRVVCYAGIAGATAVGVGRLINDRHYATDILAGAAIGFASGYLLPKWLHYGFSDDEDEGAGHTPSWAVTPLVTQSALGVSLTALH